MITEAGNLMDAFQQNGFVFEREGIIAAIFTSKLNAGNRVEFTMHRNTKDIRHGNENDRSAGFHRQTSSGRQ